MPELVNVVGGGDLQTSLQLEQLYKILKDSKKAIQIRYEPEFYAGLCFKFFEDGATIMLFSSGKYNVAGARTLNELFSTCKRVISTISELTDSDVSDCEDDYELRNLICKDKYEKGLDLVELMIAFRIKNVEYDPEINPFLYYGPPNADGLFMISRTGTILLTGMNDPKAGEESLRNLFIELDGLLA